jgi:hypothetical protein
MVYTYYRTHRHLHVIINNTSSDGKIHDFAGSYYVSIDDMAFGSPYKYVYLDPSTNEQDQWDDAIRKADDRFNKEEHNICLYILLI